METGFKNIESVQYIKDLPLFRLAEKLYGIGGQKLSSKFYIRSNKRISFPTELQYDT